MNIYQIDQNNRKSVDDFIMEHWFTMDMVVHGENVDLGVGNEIITNCLYNRSSKKATDDLLRYYPLICTLLVEVIKNDFFRKITDT